MGTEVRNNLLKPTRANPSSLEDLRYVGETRLRESDMAWRIPKIVSLVQTGETVKCNTSFYGEQGHVQFMIETIRLTAYDGHAGLLGQQSVKRKLLSNIMR